jgi:hypothetical protein
MGCMTLKLTAHVLASLDRFLNSLLTRWNSHAGANSQTDPRRYTPADSSSCFAGRIDLENRIRIGIEVRIESAFKAYRIALRVPSRLRVIVSEVVVD